MSPASRTNPALVMAEDIVARQDAVQALLGVLNDIGMCNPWKYNVITEAAEDALDAALRIVGERMSERLMHFGGFQRGEFWVSRNDVLRLIDEMTAPHGELA